MSASNLNTKDLMVGDWVKLSKGNWFENRKVELIDIEMIAESVYLADPIPITKKILEKIGFVCTHKAVEDEMEAAYECWSFRDGLLSIEFEPEVVMLEVHNGGKNGDAVRTINYFTDNDIMYLHELQHALRLCGIDKKIEL